MKSFAWVALAGLLPAAATAQSAVEVDAELFQPAAGEAFFGVGGARLLGHLKLQVGAFLNVADDPLVVFDRQGGDVVLKPVDTQSALDLVAAVGLFNYLELGVALPVLLAQNGQDLSQLGGAGSVSGGSAGDLRLSARGRLLGDPGAQEGAFFSVISEAKLPTGAGDQFFGAANPSFLVGLAAQWRSEKISLGGTLAPRFQKPVVLQNIVVGNTLEFGAGASYALTDTLSALLELDGAASLIEGNLGHTPSELRAGAKIKAGGGLSIPLGAGLSLNKGIGAPDFRLFAGVSFSPEDQDPDKDGIKAAADQCPKDPEDKDGFEDENGCPESDNDQDSLADKEDQCPNEAEDKDEFEDENGCPDLDNDQDKVADAKDGCPLVPEDIDNFEDENGCPDLDNDQDKIADVDDDCPLDPGLSAFNGCPDEDGDKIADNKDGCPKNPEDIDTFEDSDGCPDDDNDQDKIADNKDGCPLLPENYNGEKDDDGCPDKEKAVVTDQQILILEKVFFALNKAKLKTSSYAVLDDVATLLAENPSIKKVRVEGHTDDIADDRFNQKLSEKRAQAVLEYLIKKGVDPARLESKGFGESVPLEPVEGKKGKARRDAREKNRRVEFVIVEQ